MKTDDPPRIFIGLRELSGYYHHLKRGFDELGVDSVFVNLSGHPFHYGDDRNPPLINRINKAAQALGKRFFTNFALRLLWIGVFQNLLGLALFFWALCRFDVFIFGSNSTFFYFLDLPLLRLFKKKIIYVFHGSESRPVYLNGYVLDDKRTAGIATGIVLARIQKTIISIIERYADYCISIPPQAHFHEKPVISWLRMGVPHDIKEMEARQQGGDGESGRGTRVRILHAPSKPEPKGTPVIRRVVASLKEKGYEIDYVEISGRPNTEVLEELRRCDFVIDEIYSDTPMAVFATEAAFAGRPSVVGSYYAEDIYNDLPARFVPPSAFCHPDRLADTVEELVRNAPYRQQMGTEAKRFVSSRWAAAKVAERYLLLAAGRAPEDWFFDPRRIGYLHGCGLSENRARALIGRFLDVGGACSLCVSDKPELKKKMVQFARG